MKPSEENGVFRASIAAPDLRVADVNYNVSAIAECLEQADQSGTRLAVFPELCITGYTCGDLFTSRVLLEAALDGLIRLAATTAYEPVAALVGLPIEANGRIYNAAAFINDGDVIGMVPKTYLPNTNEFYEKRWFSSSSELDVDFLQFGTEKIPFGTDLLFKYRNLKNCIIGVEICEDLWTVEPPSGQAALAGASILTNLSASNEIIGKATYRKELVKQQSARCVAAYLYAASGPGESSTDIVYLGHGLVVENGIIFAE